MMRSRFAFPVRGRDIAAGFLVWLGLVLGTTAQQAAGEMARRGITVAGLLVIAIALGWVMPYIRPWPLAQWQAWRQRRGMAFATRRPLTMIFPSAYRSAFGLVIGEWLAARALDRLNLGETVGVAGLPMIAGLIVLAIIVVNSLLDS